ncbi:MAG: methyltransferase domain-containing protein [Candidatus Aminicenantes bacterium]|nr:methyltransferase domain-containing protein [Candidatus Aminicenantes bacterium]
MNSVNTYYSQKLSAEKLKLCYEIAPPRAKQYLEAEIDFILEKIKPSDMVLELGCGYGRVLEKLLAKAKTVVGIDTSCSSLLLAEQRLGHATACYLFAMDAVKLGFGDRLFDLVFCIQNGISAFGVDQRRLIDEAIRVTCSGGTVFFSSYSENFWKDRLAWFRIQSEHNLIGEIDEEATGHGTIICKDGFKATTVGPDDFASLASHLDIKPIITEVNGSSIFYEIQVKP